MSNETIYAKGLRMFNKHENAPEFVLGSMVITIQEFKDFVNNNQHLLTEYNGNKQLRCTLMKGDKGMYFAVDTYKKDQKPQEQHKQQERKPVVPDESPSYDDLFGDDKSAF